MKPDRSVKLMANSEDYYLGLEERRMHNCVITPDSVKDYIERGFVNAEPDGVVLNYGHTRGYPGPAIQVARSGVQTENIMPNKWRKKRRQRPQFDLEKFQIAKPLKAVNLVGLSLDYTKQRQRVQSIPPSDKS